MNRSQLSAPFIAAVCLALAAQETSGSAPSFSSQPVAEKLRIAREIVSVLQQKLDMTEMRLAQYYWRNCFSGYWRNC